MTRTVDFPLNLETLTFLDTGQITAIIEMEFESDSEGAYFKLTGLRWENMRVEKSDWRWSAVSEWIAVDVGNVFGFVRSAHAEHENPLTRAAGYADHLRDQRKHEAA